jgi:hypothetical protein
MSQHLAKGFDWAIPANELAWSRWQIRFWYHGNLSSSGAGM